MNKIILVEDDLTMLSLLQTLLQMEGFDVVKIKEPKFDTILAQLQQEKPELALMDVNLRDVNGFDLLKKIRSDDGLKNMRVIMSSGMDYRDDCVDKGADDFILKPYMPDDLIRRIHNLLGV